MIPAFETPRLILRAPKIEDAPAFQKYFAVPEIAPKMGEAPWPYPEDGAYTYLKEKLIPNQGKNSWDWGVFLKEKPNELIGIINIRKGKNENRGFWIGVPFQGKGYMTEALEPIMTYAFTSLGFDEIKAANATNNKTSSHIKQKTGARYIETVPSRYPTADCHEMEVWVYDKETWLKHQKIL